MHGETNITVLLQSMQPELLEEEFVFVTLPHNNYGDIEALAAKAMFMEQEGMTLVLPKLKADSASLSYSSVFRCISLTIHSSLDAVGLTAAFATTLAEHGISANVMAGFYHDHIFVNQDKAEDALLALRQLSGQ